MAAVGAFKMSSGTTFPGLQQPQTWEQATVVDQLRERDQVRDRGQKGNTARLWKEDLQVVGGASKHRRGSY